MMEQRIEDLLVSKGWSYTGGAYFIKTSPRLGWIPETGRFIIGYYEFPRPIDTIEKMQMMLKLLGL